MTIQEMKIGDHESVTKNVTEKQTQYTKVLYIKSVLSMQCLFTSQRINRI